MSSGIFDLTEEILHTLLDAATRPEDDPDYELQEAEVASYVATLRLIAFAREVGI
jgi:hypothetical protein